jgi:hypothetical protein
MNFKDKNMNLLTLALMITAVCPASLTYAQNRVDRFSPSPGIDMARFSSGTRIERRGTSAEGNVKTIYPGQEDYSTLNIEKPVSEAAYRRYRFYSDGALAVFYSFDRSFGTTGTLGTGGRLLYLMPKTTEMSYKISEDQEEIEVTTPAGQIFTISSQTGKVTHVSGADVTEESEGTPTNKGGLAISPTNGSILIDLGFNRGEAPIKPGRPVVISDSLGNKCSVFSQDVLQLFRDAGGKIDAYQLKFRTNADLRVFLTARCKNLDTSSLLVENAPVVERAPAVKVAPADRPKFPTPSRVLPSHDSVPSAGKL